jgi:hypothetical protein
VRQREHRGLAVIVDRCAAGEVAEAAHQLSVVEELVCVVRNVGPGQGQFLSGTLLQIHPDAIPGIAPVTRMALGGPARHIA